MPILEINILGSKIAINYQKDEKEKLTNYIEQFKQRLSEFKNLEGKFTDNKIILLAALKAEDNIYELKQIIDDQKKIIDSSNTQQGQIDNKIREIVNLKDQLASLNETNQKYEEINNITLNKFEKINNKLLFLIDKIINTNKNDY